MQLPKPLFILFFLAFQLTEVTCYGQEKEYFNYTTLSAQYDVFSVDHYNSPNLNPTRETFGFSFLATTGIVASPNFLLAVKLGYRYVNNYAHPEAVFNFLDMPESDLLFFNYNGGYAGLGFNLGRRHLWESSLIIGGGLMKKPGFAISNAEMEFGLQTGYKYIAPRGLMLRFGVASNYGRNGFFSFAYSAYAGLGYAFQHSKQTVKKEYKKERANPYFNISVNGYIGSLTLEFVGAQLRADHFLFNGPNVDLGYSVAFNAGLDFDGDRLYSASAAFVGLFGAQESKLEFAIGPNFPLGDMNNNFLAWYERVHLGVGLRFVPEDIPLTIRIGSATTSILYVGIGVRF